jgi:hypothetical protein
MDLKSTYTVKNNNKFVKLDLNLNRNFMVLDNEFELIRRVFEMIELRITIILNRLRNELSKNIREQVNFRVLNELVKNSID